MSNIHSYTISGDVSDWLYDLLPLSNSNHYTGEFLEFSSEDLRSSLAFEHQIDYVYPLGNNAILAVSLQDKAIVVYNYKNKLIGDQYRVNTADEWLDVFCLPPLFQESISPKSPSLFNSDNTDETSIYILTNRKQVIKLHTQQQLKQFRCEIIPDYSIDIPSAHHIAKILPCREKEKGRYGIIALDTFYLWLPSKRLLQKYSLFPNLGKIEPTPRLSTEIKLRFPDYYEGNELHSKVHTALTLYLDEVGQSVIVADACNQCIFEFSLTEKSAKDFYSILKETDSRVEERSDADRLYSPYFPLVLRPQAYVQNSLLSSFSQRVNKADVTGVLPRILLVFDKERLIKIWQFPEASEALDYSGQTIVNILMVKKDYAPDPKPEPMNVDFNELRSMSIGSAGQLAVVAKEAVYLLFSGVSSAESHIHATDGLSEDT